MRDSTENGGTHLGCCLDDLEAGAPGGAQSISLSVTTHDAELPSGLGGGGKDRNEQCQDYVLRLAFPSPFFPMLDIIYKVDYSTK